MTSSSHDDLGARMARLIDAELTAAARVSLGAEPPAADDAAGHAGADRRLVDDVLRITAAALRIAESELDPTENLHNFGVDSIAITEIMARISRAFGISVAPTTFFEARDLDDLARILRARHGAAIEAHYAATTSEPEPKPEPSPEPSPDPNRQDAEPPEAWIARHRRHWAASGPRRLVPAPRMNRPEAPTESGSVPIAIIGMDGRFPKSPDLEAFAAHLRAGADCMEEVPAARWDWRAVDGDPDKGPFTNVRFGGFVPDVDTFDAAFFRIAPREAELMDPQHRLFMECVWAAIEHAGHAPGALAGRKVGLFVGINLLDYVEMANRAGIMEAQQLTGLGHAFCPNRLSFLLDIHGPSQVVDTACSSSLVALHRAVMSIRHEGCEMAIAGGSNLMLSPLQHIMFSKVGMIAPDGRCKTFSGRADGYGRSDGVGAVLLKRLDMAERDGDPILGVIRASVEHHGGNATSLTAPNPKAQARLVAEAHQAAGIDPRTVGMIECHGTGTPLGDPVEVEGLKAAFAHLYHAQGLKAPQQPHIGLGSVKSNIGHTETAAGIAGLIKVLLAFRHETLFKSLHCGDPNPLLELDGTPFYLLSEPRPWDRPCIDGMEHPRRAGLSSFGAGGANVHVVLEEYRRTDSADQDTADLGQGSVVVPVSAREQDALRAAVTRLRAMAEQAPLADFAYSLQVGRDAMRHRVAFVAETGADLARRMDVFLSGEAGKGVRVGVAARAPRADEAPLDPTGMTPEQVAARWAEGAAVDWNRLYAGARRRRLSLPAYPFQRKRYWLPLPPAPVEKPAGPFARHLSGDEFFLADHRVNGRPVLPGVVYLDIIRRAVRAEGVAEPALTRVVWQKPLAVLDPVTIEVDLSAPSDGPRRAEVYSVTAGGTRTLHAQAEVGPGPPQAPTSVDLSALRARCATTIAADRVYAAFDGMRLAYGPGHRAITALAFGDLAEGGREVVADLTLPEAVAGTLDTFDLHPSLMDGAFQAAIGMTLDPAGGAPSGAALPFALASAEVFGPCLPDMVAHVRPAADGGEGGRVQRLDIDLLAPGGSVRVRLRGFATRQAVAPAPALRFVPEWRAVAASDTPPPASALVLLCGGPTATRDALARHLAPWTVRRLDDDPATDLAGRYTHLAAMLLKEMQALPAGPPTLVQWVVPEGPEAPMLAGLGGLLRTAAMERRGLSAQVVRVANGLDGVTLAKRLRDSAGAGPRVRLNIAGTTVERWAETAPIAALPPWRADGVYLITGGLGGLGRRLAGAILDAAPGAAVALVGRSAPDDDGRAWMDGLGGARLSHHAVDVTDADAVATLVADLRRRHGRVDGVLHAAGVLRDAALPCKTPEQLAEVLAPKVAGAVNLDRAVGSAPLDLFALFSSIAGVFGNPGQADYAAANAFLDGFAEAREARRLSGTCQGRTVAIAWPLWRDGGMAMDEASQALMTRTTGLVPLETADGLAILNDALAGHAARVVALPGDADHLRRWVTADGLSNAQGIQPPPKANPVVPRDVGALGAAALKAVTRIAAARLKVDASDLEPDVDLTEYGFDSIGFTQLANALNDHFALELTPTLFFEHPTLDGLATHLARAETAALAAALGMTAPEPDAASTPAPAQEGRPRADARPAQAVPTPPTPLAGTAVAIIGMSGQFPGAPDVAAFWTNLAGGRDCIGEVPAERWDWRAIEAAHPEAGTGGTVRHGGFMDGIAAFDAAFFGITPPEARMMDPQQRLLLTQAWRLMEAAGYAPRRLSGSRTGVFLGIADTGYGRLLANAGAGVEGFAMTGLAPSLGPNRISHVFNLNGPSVAVETACSSALVAIHRAVQAIAAGGCEAAIAGGVNTLLLPDSFIGFSKAGMLSPGGRCKPFSDDADGYARGEGLGLVLLKPLAEAERDGDRILAVIRASAENHGGRAGSLTAPNPRAQAELLRTVYRQAGFDPRTVSYIEAHGTGTPLGDPIEVEALKTAFADLAREAEAIHGPAPSAVTRYLGAVKSNIGHLEIAAGAAGLIKVVQQMQHATLAGTLHCDHLNPLLALDGSGFEVVRETRPWDRPKDSEGRPLPRRAGVSSFGFGGSNSHIVLEEYSPEETPAPAMEVPGPHIVVLSARNEDRLKESARRLRDAVARLDEGVPLVDIAYTLQVAREPMAHRLGFLAADRAEVLARLDALLEGRDDPDLFKGTAKDGRAAIGILESDAELRRGVAGLAARGRADGLLELWVRGLEVDWRALHGGSSRRLVALPGYPFADTAYWVPGPAPAPVAAPPPPVAAPVDPPSEPVSEADTHPAPGREERALDALVEIAARVLEVDPATLDADTELGEFGFDSITMTTFASKVNANLGLSLTPADFFEYATLRRLAVRVAADLPASAPRYQAQPKPVPTDASPAHDAGTDQPDHDDNDDPVVIVGYSARLPGGMNSEAFWHTLTEGRDCITRVPPDRWDWRALDGDPKTETGKTNVHWAGFIDGVFGFDPLFFNISPREARLMDPQQRLLMMHAWNALEDAGHDPTTLAGRRVGLFVGTAASGYPDADPEDAGGEGYVATGSVASVGPNRVSYFLDLHGPSEPVETACSSSLVALHRATRAIRDGDCDMALAGGVNTIVTPHAHINFAKAGMLSPDGRCKTFSSAADGYGRGEGVAIVVLKRLSQAQRDGDPIRAVLRASAINHGGRANSLTAPNTTAQAALLRDAYRRAGIDPHTVGYIEAHGTGTALGDPAEINALKAAFRDLLAEAPNEPLNGVGCGLGSVKTNIGHLELAAGAAGVIKVLLQMEHGTLVPSLHCDEINPFIDLSGTMFEIVRARRPWTPVRDAAGRTLPRRAGVSSFGFGGVNAHVVLEEYRPPPAPARKAEGPVVVVLSARDQDRLRDRVRDLAAVLDSGRLDPANDLADLAYTLQVGRTPMAQRLALVVDSLAALGDRLKAYLDGGSQGLWTGRAADRRGAEEPGPDASPQALAAHWVAGGAVDWAAMTQGPRRRLRLPGYPFASDDYRIGAAAPEDEPALGTVRLEADAFYLRDHRVRGHRVLPGAMSLDLACTGSGRDIPTHLARVVWLRPLTLDHGSAAVSVSVDDGGRLALCGPDGVEHMTAEVADAPPHPAPRLNLTALKATCGRVLDPDWLYAAYAALGLHYGPAFRVVKSLSTGGGAVLARLQLPPAARDDARTFTIHPSLLDGAFHAALGLLTDDAAGEGHGPMALPFAVEGVTVFGPTTETMWAHVRARSGETDTLRLDIDLADDEGQVTVAVRGFALRLLDRPTKADQPPVPPAATRDERAPAEAFFRHLVARETGLAVDAIALDVALEAYGIDSVLIVRLTDELEKMFGPQPKTLFFDHRTLGGIVDHFLSTQPETLARVVGTDRPSAEPTPPASADATPVARATQAPATDDPIAIIGLAGRYPGAEDVDAFWRVLSEGRDCITEIPGDRWGTDRPTGQHGRWGGFIDGVDRFDPLFFNISPREADSMDPQERLFLQTAWQALEDAGMTRATVAPPPPPLSGADVGVFVGVMYEDYQLYGAEQTAAGRPMALGGSPATIANRVSYFFDFQGPSMAVDTMCSSSLTAIHLACDSLRSGGCAVALAGGVNLTLHPNKYLALGQGRFLSSKGRCESFGQGGDGYVPGEGVGAALLKPLSRAIADNDRIHGVIRGSALNHGGKTNGYTVPNPAAQTAVIGRALTAAGVTPDQIGYVEAHGTGTSLGDPIEIAALGRAWGDRPSGVCPIGSVKSNIGHCESAAGMAGLTKVLLQFRHAQLVPSLHAETLNPNIDFQASPFRVQRRLEAWTPPAGGRRMAALSSFGAGGANAHVILEHYEAPAPAVTPARGVRRVFPLSARDPERLDEAAARLRAAVANMGEEALASVAHTLQTGREAFEERLAIVAADQVGFMSALDAVQQQQACPAGVHRGRLSRNAAAPSDPFDPDAVAAAWVLGADVSWRALWDGDAQMPPRIGLPGYPFARDRHWVPGEPAPVVAADPDTTHLFAPCWREEPAPEARSAPDAALLVLCEMPEAAHQVLDGSDAEVMALPVDDRPPALRFTDHAARLLARLKGLAGADTAPALVQVVGPADDDTAPLLEGLAGLLRCARLEMPSIRFQVVAVEPGAPDLAGRLAPLLETDRAVAREHGEVRHQGDRRLVRRWRELATVQRSACPWMDSGVYLLTGGLGGLGRIIAEDIAARAKRPFLWLVGRTPPSDEAKDWMEALPAETFYRAADVTDAEAMARLVEEITALNGRLTGVIHAAGLVRDAMIANKREADLRAVLAPKVAGVTALDAATAHLDLDVMVLFASAAGALGNRGQADYAAANAYLDGFAATRNAWVAAGQRRGRTLALDWPYWADGGMRLDDAMIDAVQRDTGVRPLTTAAALRALDAALAQTEADQVLVLHGDGDRLRRLMTPAETGSDPMPVPPPPPEAPDPSRRERVFGLIAARFAETLKVPLERLDPDAPIDRFGVDSVSALEIIESLKQDFGSLPNTVLFEHPTLARLADHLTAQAQAPAEPDQPRTGPTPAETPATGDTEGVAVIAVAGRFPGADTVEDFWAALKDGRDLVTEVPAERWDQTAIRAGTKGQPGRTACHWGGFIADVDRFDAGFFGYTPRQAALSDPQERLFLETTWHLLDRAAHPRPLLRDRYQSRVGVFVGSMYQHYAAFASDPDDRALLSLSSYSAIANRTSFFFDLQGPSVAVDSMCASGLQAVHQACQSLRLGECGLAIAGGVNLSLHPDKVLGLDRAGLAASNPASRGFAAGDGYLPAEGVGAVLLKPLAEARRDGDRVLGVIRGSAANHAGHSAGYAVPNADAQTRLIEDTLTRSGIDPRSIGYVEAAANGSPIGDAIEVRALTRAFREFTEDEEFCAIGSVKTIMGHAEAASGLAALVKVLLMLEHRSLVPSVRADLPGNADVSFAGTPFVPQTAFAHWPRPELGGLDQPRRAVISSIGAGGSHVLMILEEPAETLAGASKETDRPRRFRLSARTPEQLEEVRRRLATYVADTPDLSLARLSCTLRQGRETLDCRLEIVARTREDLLTALRHQQSADTDATDPDADAPETITGPPLVLPPYPFARERHWLDGACMPPSPPSNGEAMATEMADPLAIIMATIAGETGVAVDSLDPDAAFARLRLDSMGAMRLFHIVRAATGIDLAHRDLQAHSTPRRLAAHISASAAPRPDAPPDVVEPAGDDTALTPTVADGWRADLSENQLGLWVLQTLYPRSGVYNVPMAFRLKGVEPGALDRACAWMLDRFPILRARLQGEETDRPALVAGPMDGPLVRVATPKDMDAIDFARRHALRPFVLTDEAPCRFDLLHGGSLDEDEAILLITLHHIVCDGASAALLARWLWHAHARFANGTRPDEPDGTTDYARFTAWERDFLSSDRAAAQRRHWLALLADSPPLPDLPTDHPARPHGTIDGRCLERPLGSARARAVEDAASALGVTSAAFFLGVLAAALYRITGARDTVVGVPTLRRPEPRFANTVGYCANIIAVRLRVEGEQTAEALLQDVQARLTEGLDHADYPFAALARDLGGGVPGQPLYQIVYAYETMARDTAGGGAGGFGEVVYLPQVRQVGDTAFGLEVHQDADGLRLVAGYDGARFEPATVERLLDHITTLLDGLCANPAQPVAALPMLSRRERARLLHAWGDGGSVPPPSRPVSDRIARQARKAPDAIAVEANGATVTYRDLNRRANRLARHLRMIGVRPGDAVAVLLEREPRAVETLLAVLQAGGVWVPLDPESPDGRLGMILEASGSHSLIAAGPLARRAMTVAPDMTVVDLDGDQAAIARQSPRPLRRTPAPEAPAYMIHTSGTTGMPKGVVVSHTALSEHCQVVASRYGLTSHDVVLQFASHVVDTAVEQILPTLAEGARLVMRTGSAWMPDAFMQLLVTQGITVADLPPAYLREILVAVGETPAPAGLHLRLCLVGGESLTPDLVRLWRAGPLARARLLNCYGPTEATVTALVHDVTADPPDTPTIPIGRPLPGTRVAILDRDGNPVPEGTKGELHIGGARLAIGYHGRPDLSAQRFVTRTLEPGRPAVRLYRTGDLASFMSGREGVIAFHGRLDQQVKVRGFRVEPGEIETALEGCGLRAAAVVPMGDDLVAYVVPGEAAFDERAVRDRLADRLPAPMLPIAYVALDALPLTMAGKLDRAALPAPERRRVPAVSLRTDLERRIHAIWTKVLGRADVGADDDFAASGGHSLLAVRLLQSLERAFGRSLSIADLATANTIAAQARLIGSNAPPDDATPLPAALVCLRRPSERQAAPRPPLFLVHPLSGTVGCYAGLACALSADRAVYGLQATAETPASLDAMAAWYVQDLRRVHSRGPVCLAGWSMGGVIAFAMARYLRERGETVAFLGLIDSFTPEALERLGLSGFGAEDVDRDMRAMQTVGAGAGARADDGAIAIQARETALANGRLLQRHRSQPCDVDATLMRAVEGPPGEDPHGWRGLVGGRLTVLDLPGDHYGLLTPQGQAACARLIDQALADRG